jgi:hypothetical protein
MVENGHLTAGRKYAPRNTAFVRSRRHGGCQPFDNLPEPPRDLRSMSRAAPTSVPADLTDRQLAMLERLAEIGMQIAEAAGRQARATGEGEGAAVPDPALSFSRTARAVRLTIALQAPRR